MVKKILFACLAIALVSFGLLTNFQDLVLEKLEAYTVNYPEKVYVKTDKPYYVLGDNIWYVAYLVNGVNHKESNKSKIVYVELINDKDSIVSQRRLFVNDVSSVGDFEIKKDWKPGNYLLRAYTNYMRNNNQDYFFKKEIPIWDIKESDTLLNLFEKPTKNNKNSENQAIITERPELKFYPEGGYLINGIQSKIGVKVKSKNTEFKGVVKDSEGNTISAFQTFEFGLGSLTFTPQPNKTYYASIKVNGEEEKYELPKALMEGFNLNVLNNGAEVVFKASSNTSIGLKNAFLVAHQRGKVLFQKLIDKTTNKFTVKINTEKLNTGITHVTLFDNNGKPVCERLVFVDNPTADIAVNINKNTETPRNREKVTLQIDLKDKIGNPVSGNLSLAINDMEVVQKNYNDDNIKSYLLLNSDLRGEIENPGYFFEKGNDFKRRSLLDLVMLTHGWRRFTWNDILYSLPKTKNQFKIEKGLFISGQTRDLKNSTKLISVPTRLTLLEKGKVPFQELKQSNLNGQFNFGPYVFYDSISTLVEARLKDFKSDNDKNREVAISIRKENYKSPVVTRNHLFRKSAINKTVLTNFIERSESVFRLDTAYANSDQRLKEIIITVNKKTEEQKRNQALDSLTDYGSPSRRLDMNDIIGASSFNIATLLRRLPGVNIINDSITVKGRRPAILLDGFSVEYSDVTYLSGSNIEFIDFLSGASASVYRGGTLGVIAIYTKTGDGNIKKFKSEPGIINFNYPGFYTAKEFYSPDYSDSFSDHSKKDIRTTLYWEPKIVVNNNAKAEVTFYTSDSRTDYGVEIEGITDTGIPVYHYSTFSVE